MTIVRRLARPGRAIEPRRRGPRPSISRDGPKPRSRHGPGLRLCARPRRQASRKIARPARTSSASPFAILCRRSLAAALARHEPGAPRDLGHRETAICCWPVALGEHIVLVATALVLLAADRLSRSASGPRDGPALLRRPPMTATGVASTPSPALALFALLIPFHGIGQDAGHHTALVPLLASHPGCANIAIGNPRGSGRGWSKPPTAWATARVGGCSGSSCRWPLPVIVAGIRHHPWSRRSRSATVAAYINAGGLGDIIFQGITQDLRREDPRAGRRGSPRLLAIAARRVAEACRAAAAPPPRSERPLMPGRQSLAWLGRPSGGIRNRRPAGISPYRSRPLIAAMGAGPCRLALVAGALAHRAAGPVIGRGSTWLRTNPPALALLAAILPLLGHRLPALRHRAHALTACRPSSSTPIRRCARVGIPTWSRRPGSGRA